MDNEKVVNDGISFAEILYIVKKHLIAIVLFVVVLTGCGFTASKIKNKVSPTFEGSSSMMVSVDAQSTSLSLTSAYQLSSYLTDTFVVFIKEDVVIDMAVETLNATYPEITSKNLKQDLEVAMKSDSLIMELTYTGSSKQKVADVLNTVMNCVYDVANKVNGTEPAYKMLNGNIAIVDKAELSKIEQKSSTLKYTLVFFAIGVVAAFIYVLLKEMLDKRFKDSDEVEKLLDVPVLATVPEYEVNTKEEK